MKPNAAALLRTRVVIGIAMAMGAGSAAAIEFSFGDGWKGNWNTTIGADDYVLIFRNQAN